MARMKLRGQEVLKEGNILRFEIKRPLGGVFSISDSVKKYVDCGCTAVITVAGKERQITKETPYLRIEEVKSKFPDQNPWHRYWYSLGSPEQIGLFDEAPYKVD